MKRAPWGAGVAVWPLLVENTAIDYLDFDWRVKGLGCKMGLGDTNKWSGETQRE